MRFQTRKQAVMYPQQWHGSDCGYAAGRAMNSTGADSGMPYRGSAIQHKELVKRPTARKGWCSEQTIQAKQHSEKVRGWGSRSGSAILAWRARTAWSWERRSGQTANGLDDLLCMHLTLFAGHGSLSFLYIYVVYLFFNSYIAKELFFQVILTGNLKVHNREVMLS